MSGHLNIMTLENSRIRLVQTEILKYSGRVSYMRPLAVSVGCIPYHRFTESPFTGPPQARGLGRSPLLAPLPGFAYTYYFMMVLLLLLKNTFHWSLKTCIAFILFSPLTSLSVHPSTILSYSPNLERELVTLVTRLRRALEVCHLSCHNSFSHLQDERFRQRWTCSRPRFFMKEKRTK